MTTQQNKKTIHRNSRREITTGEAVEAAIALSKEEGPIWESSYEKSFAIRKKLKKTGACIHNQQ